MELGVVRMKQGPHRRRWVRQLLLLPLPTRVEEKCAKQTGVGVLHQLNLLTMHDNSYSQQQCFHTIEVLNKTNTLLTMTPMWK